MAALWVPVILVLQFLMGLGLLRRLRVSRSTTQQAALGMLLGLPLSSLVVFLLDLVGIHLTLVSVLAGFLVAAALLNAPWPRQPRLTVAVARAPRTSFRAYEWPFVVFLVWVAAISVWRAYYLPVTLRDAIVGLDLVAKYAAAQGTLRSTVFSDPQLQGHLSNQPFYAPFPMLMQVVFRLAGLPFGQLWLSAMFLSFVVFFYSRLRESVHSVVAGVVMVLLLAVPEMYAHTFMVLNDYPTAVFFGLSVVLFHEHFRDRRSGAFLLSALFIGFACWTRADTIFFALPGAGMAVWLARRGAGRGGGQAGLRSAWAHGLVFAAIPGALVLLWHGLYLGLILRQGPEGPGVAGALELFSLPGAFYRTAWLFGQAGRYGYLVYVFFAVALANLVFLRDRSANALLAWVAILYLGFVAILFALPAASLEGTLKRGFFKFFPVMAFYLAESRLLRLLSERIVRWEQGGA